MRYKKGDPPFWCPRCSFRVRYSDTMKEYTGLRVCSKCYDPKHPRLDIHGIPERAPFPDASIEPAATDISGVDITIEDLL